VSGAILLHLAHRPLAAVALATAGLFLAKILILPIVVALLLVTPAARQAKAWLTALGTLGVGALVTWAISGTDGLSQQLGYTEEVIGFSISAWSTLVLHHVFEPVTAIRISIGLALVGVAVTLFLWQRDRLRDDLEGSRLGAALVVASIALLAVSNPEYICVAAPMAIVGCIGLRATMQATLLIAMSSVAWAINFVYYLLRKAYDTTGTMLGLEGFVTPTGRTVRILDATHQVALVLFAYLACVVVWNYVVTPGRTAAKETATADV
jgi:hypothetical protein